MNEKYTVFESEIINESLNENYPSIKFTVFVLLDSNTKTFEETPLYKSLLMQSYQNYDIQYIYKINELFYKIEKSDCDYFIIAKPKNYFLFNALNTFALYAQKDECDIFYADECAYNTQKGYGENEVSLLRPNFSKKQLINENVLGQAVAIKKAFFYKIKEKIKSKINIKHETDIFFNHLVLYTSSVKHIYKILFNRGTDAQIWDYKKSSVLSKERNNILVICHELTRTGAPIVLRDSLKILKQQGYNIVLISYRDNEIWEDFKELDLNLFLIDSAKSTVPILSKIANDFDLVLINTIEPYFAAIELCKVKTPILWWVHESEEFLNFIKPKLPKRVSDNFSIYNVSKFSANEMERILPYYRSRGILRSIYNDVSDKYEGKKYKKVSFLCIGTVYHAKGQDILVDAIKALPEGKREQCEFLFIGENKDDRIFEKIISLCNEFPQNVRHINPIPQEKLFPLVKASTCMLCPSRREALSGTVVEAMMLSVPSIVSEFAGITELIKDGENGLIYKHNNVQELKKCMIKVIDSRELTEKMGQNARKTYEENFSCKAFSKSFLDIIKNLINKK